MRLASALLLAAGVAVGTVGQPTPAAASTCSPSVASLSEMRTALSAGVNCAELVVTVTGDITVSGGQLEYVADGDLVIQSDGTTRTLDGGDANRILFTGRQRFTNGQPELDYNGDPILDNGSVSPLPKVTLIDLVLTRGKPSSSDLSVWESFGVPAGGRGGGAMYASRSVELRDVTISHSEFTGTGGGMMVENGPLVIVGGAVHDNTAVNAAGIRVSHTRVGADDLCVSVEGHEVYDNVATGETGGLQVQCDSGEGIVTISSSRFVQNSGGSATQYATGGAVQLLQLKSTNISDTLFEGNSQAEYGGGALNVNDGTLTISGSSFIDNVATDPTNGEGGAIRTSRPAVTITNSTFSGNSAKTGSTLFSGSSSGVTTLTHVTLVGDADEEAIRTGGGSSTLRFNGSVIADTAGGCANLGSLEASHSVITATACANPTGAGNWIDGTDGTWSNAWLAAPTDNGGVTPTRLPATSQPTVFRRVPVAGGVCADLSGVDQRGEARPGRRGESNCWAGAVEIVVDDPLIVTASSHSITAGDAVPTITGASSVSGVSIDGMTCSTTYTTSSPAGTYPTTCSGGSAYRYAITYVAGEVTAAAAPTTTAAPPTTAAPTTTTVALAPVVANAGLQAGSKMVTVDGVEVPVTLTREANTVTLTGDGFGMSLVGLDENQTPGELDADGNLILQAGGFTRVSGSGFAPDTDVKVYLFSDPVLLGTVRTDATGAFDATLPVPADTPAGVHTVQANGFTTDGKIRSMNLGVVIPASSAVLPATGGDTGVPSIALALGVAGLLGVLASRRRTTH